MTAMVPPPSAGGAERTRERLLDLPAARRERAPQHPVVGSEPGAHLAAAALSRAFLVAGVRRVVASLWPADDDATAALVGSFFREVARGEREGPDYARALAEAKAAVRGRAEWSAPFFWAPFVLDGAP